MPLDTNGIYWEAFLTSGNWHWSVVGVRSRLHLSTPFLSEEKAQSC